MTIIEERGGGTEVAERMMWIEGCVGGMAQCDEVNDRGKLAECADVEWRWACIVDCL